MYNLYASESMDQLLNSYGDLLEQKPGDAPFLLIIQSSVMQRWFKQEFAKKRGLCFLPRLLVPEAAWRLLISKMQNPDPEASQKQAPSSLYLDDLILLCFKHLQEITRLILTKTPEAEELRRTYKAILPWINVEKADGSLAEASELRQILSSDALFDLANECAGVFFSYAQNPLEVSDGPDLLQTWRSSGPEAGPIFIRRYQAASAEPETAFLQRLAEHEQWQAHLYRRMFAARQGKAEELSNPSLILGESLAKLIREGFVYTGPWKKIVLLGSAFLSQQAFDFLHYLARPKAGQHEALEVHHLLFHPGQQARIGSPAYAWSELLQDFLRTTEERTQSLGFLSKSYFENDSEKPALTDLEKIRSLSNKSLSALTENPASRPEQEALNGDESFLLLKTSGRQREVQELHRLIYRELGRADSKLNVSDILVMAPDINAYKALIESRFGPPGNWQTWEEEASLDPEHLPWNMADLGMQGESDFLNALRSLLNLGKNRWTREEVFQVLDRRCFQARNGLSKQDIEKFLQFTTENGIRWGLNSKHRALLGGGENGGQTWNKAFRRFCENLPYPPNLDEEDQLPLDAHNTYGQSEASLFGQLFYVLHRLRSQLEQFKKTRHSMLEWVRLHQELMDQYLGAPEKIDKKHQEAARSTLNNLTNLERPGREEVKDIRIDWYSFLRFFQDQMDEVEDGLGQRLCSGITFSSLRPWRAVSFKLIVLLGMNEKDFPRRNQAQVFDLGSLADYSRKKYGFEQARSLLKGGRKSSEVQDAYTWLETLYSAGEKLWIFWQGIDPSDGKERLASPFIDELLMHLGEENRQKILRKIEVHPFNSKNLEDYEDPRKTLRTLALEGRLVPGQSKVSFNEERELKSLQKNLSYKELAQSLLYPVRAYARYLLYLKPLDEEDPREASEENWSLEYLDTRKWLQYSALAELEGKKDLRTSDFFVHAEEEDLFAPGTLAKYSVQMLDSKVQDLKEIVQEYKEQNPQTLHPCDLEPAYLSLDPKPLIHLDLKLSAREYKGYKRSDGSFLYVLYNDSVLELAKEKKSEPNKSDMEKRLNPGVLVFSAWLLHLLGTEGENSAEALLVSPNAKKEFQLVRCKLPSWQAFKTQALTELPDLAKILPEAFRILSQAEAQAADFFGALFSQILARPLCLYKNLIKTYSLQADTHKDQFWNSYWQSFQEGEESSFTLEKDYIDDKADSPEDCPYYELLWGQALPDTLERSKDFLDYVFLPLYGWLSSTVEAVK